MGLFGFLNYAKKKKLLTLQLFVIPDAPTNKLIVSESKLLQFARQRASNDLRILQDSLNLVQSTTKPNVFFSRLQLAEECMEHLMLFEQYISFSGVLPSTAYKQYLKEREQCVREFISRYYADVHRSAKEMKTEKGRNNKYRKSYDALKQYPQHISDNNKRYAALLFDISENIDQQKIAGA